MNDVIKIIEESFPPLTQDHIGTLMRKLNTALMRKNVINSELKSDNISVYDALELILHEWRFRESDNATLSTFVLHLKKSGLASHADALQRKYKTNKLELDSYERSVDEDVLPRNIPNPINYAYKFNIGNDYSAQVPTSSSSAPDTNSPFLAHECVNTPQNNTETRNNRVDISDRFYGFKNTQPTLVSRNQGLCGRISQSSPGSIIASCVAIVVLIFNTVFAFWYFGQ